MLIQNKTIIILDILDITSGEQQIIYSAAQLGLVGLNTSHVKDAVICQVERHGPDTIKIRDLDLELVPMKANDIQILVLTNKTNTRL